jgi:hypothetical protein
VTRATGAKAVEPEPEKKPSDRTPAVW